MKTRFDTAKNLDDPTVWPSGWVKWNPAVLFRIALYIGACLIGLLSVPNTLFDAQTMAITMTIGLLGIWRYGWWFTHAVRAVIYGRLVYPKMRRKGQEI